MKVLALVTTRRARPGDLVEMLRIVAALVGCEVEVRLAELQDAGGALTDDALPEEAERVLDQLRALGVTPEVLVGEALDATLAAVDAILRLGDPERAGTPAVLEIGGEPTAAAALAAAGQVVARAAASP